MSNSTQVVFQLEISEIRDRVVLYGSADTLRMLARVCERLAVRAELGENDHEHFFSSDWGTGDLTTTPFKSGEVCAQMFTVQACPKAVQNSYD